MMQMGRWLMIDGDWCDGKLGTGLILVVGLMGWSCCCCWWFYGASPLLRAGGWSESWLKTVASDGCYQLLMVFNLLITGLTYRELMVNTDSWWFMMVSIFGDNETVIWRLAMVIQLMVIWSRVLWCLMLILIAIDWWLQMVRYTQPILSYHYFMPINCLTKFYSKIVGYNGYTFTQVVLLLLPLWVVWQRMYQQPWLRCSLFAILGDVWYWQTAIACNRYPFLLSTIQYPSSTFFNIGLFYLYWHTNGCFNSSLNFIPTVCYLYPIISCLIHFNYCTPILFTHQMSDPI